MKIVNGIFIVILFVTAGCGERQKDNGGFITVDITKNYPKKEMILQDFMSVEYVPLETNDEFICQGIVLAVGKDVMLVKNEINDGNIYVFDRNGKGLRIINRRGQGGDEYNYISEILLDEKNNEMFINKHEKLLVYDLYGNFKRSLLHKEGSSYRNFTEFDRKYIICKDNSFEGVTDRSPFVVLSKQDGSIIKEIPMIIQQKIETVKKISHNGFTVFSYRSYFPPLSITHCHESCLLTVYSNDTVYRYLPDHSMTPFMVRTPSLESNNTISFLSPGILTERYYFLQKEKFEPEVKGTTPEDATVFYPKTYLMYDIQEKKIYEYTVYNDDYSSKMTVEMIRKGCNDEIAFWQKIEAYELVEAYRKGQLKGKLKDVAEKLDEESNPVIMLVKINHGGDISRR